MKDRRRRGDVTWRRFFWFTLIVALSYVFFSGFTFSALRVIFGESFHPVLGSTHRTSAIKAISDDSPVSPALWIRETVMLPDQVLIFLNYPPSARLFTKDDLDCVYLSSANSSEPKFSLSPAQTDRGDHLGEQIIRCPVPPRGITVSVALKPNSMVPAGPTHRWDSLAYEAMIDSDNTTIVFVKGLNLRPARAYNGSRFECVYGWDFQRPMLLIRSEALTAAQEIIRCKTPLSVLNSQRKSNGSIKVSIRVKGRGLFHSTARLGQPTYLDPNPSTRKPHEMCICTMVRNQARFLKEWVMYHSRIGVQRWYIYDNNSDDDTSAVIQSLIGGNYNISRHIWPWIKTQEAGFAHCALRATESCQWVGFIDVDEFFHIKSGLVFRDVLENVNSRSSSNLTNGTVAKKHSTIGEIRVSCYSFGPSGRKHVPIQGVMAGYTCRMQAPERHKSITRPEALNATLINIVHHFHLRKGFRFMNMNKGMMVLNHYKYQVWEVFKEKFHRRVATYVADWRDEKNEQSKDRAPGLGTRAIEPTDWSSRFCEVRDTGLRDRVLENFVNPRNQLLPWQEGYELGGHKRRVRKRRHRISH